MNTSNSSSRGLLPLSSLAAGLALASTGAHAVLVTSSGPVSVPSGNPIDVPSSVMSNIGGVGLQVQNFFQADAEGSIYLGINGGFLHKNALAGGTDVGSLAFDFPFNGQTSVKVAMRQFDNAAGTWVAPTGLAGFVIGQEHNYYGFKYNNASNSPLYGWIDLKATSSDPFAGLAVTVNGWAYDDSGASVTVPSVSAIPEPSTLALAAAGLALVGAATRRRRQQQRQAA